MPAPSTYIISTCFSFFLIYYIIYILKRRISATRNKKLVFLAINTVFINHENTLYCKNFNRNSSNSSRDRGFKHYSFFLGIKGNFFSRQNFNLDLKSENVEFLKCSSSPKMMKYPII